VGREERRRVNTALGSRVEGAKTAQQNENYK
jgi:hypothetical protein